MGGAAPRVGEKNSSSRKKSVRLSVDSGTSENLAESDTVMATVKAPKERVVSVSEIDPGLLLAATLFVQVSSASPLSRVSFFFILCMPFPQDLTETAKIEADRRLHPPTETLVRFEK